MPREGEGNSVVAMLDAAAWTPVTFASLPVVPKNGKLANVTGVQAPISAMATAEFSTKLPFHGPWPLSGLQCLRQSDGGMISSRCKPCICSVLTCI